MKIGVFGLGYVGIVNVACLSRQGHTVYCTDVKKFKTAMVAEGKSPIHEPEVNELLAAGISNGTIIPTDSISEILDHADVFMVCVGTPSKPDGEVNLTYLNNVVFEIATNLRSGDGKFIVFRSTVPPGTTQAIYDKHLKNSHPGLVPVFYPEFLREGSAVSDFFNYGRLVLGAHDGHNIDRLVALFQVNEKSPTFITDFRTAEFTKYVDNGFHALKVAFANEVFGVGAAHGVDVKTAHKIFVADDKLNVSAQYLRPGLPFGGSCLPKDLRELQYLMGKSGRPFELLNHIIPSNEAFIAHILDKIRSFGKTRISFIGITFKNHSDDLRESPMLRICNQLMDSGEYQILVADDDINQETVRVEFPALYSVIREIPAAVEQAELVVVSKRFLEKTMQLKRPGQIVLNLSDLGASDPESGLYALYG